MNRSARSDVFAERVLVGIDDQGAEERIVIWIERRPGALWAVGRAVNPQLRSDSRPRPEDVLFEGYELDDDLHVSSDDGRPQELAPFRREELLQPLERWFFGHVQS